MSKPRFKTIPAWQAFNIVQNSCDFDWEHYVSGGEFEKVVIKNESEGYRFVSVVMNGGAYVLFERIDNEG